MTIKRPGFHRRHQKTAYTAKQLQDVRDLRLCVKQLREQSEIGMRIISQSTGPFCEPAPQSLPEE